MRSRLIRSIIISLTGFSPLAAQYYDTGQDPPGLKWVQVKTGKFRIIYPEKYGSSGVDFARSLEQAYSVLSPVFPAKKVNMPVIIHNYTTNSNGYVAWAPKRMEIYPTPGQDCIPLDPHTHLALHELTHVFQMTSLNRGFSRMASLFLGQQFTGLAASMLPLWYMEGDAVFNETLFTGSGRGRSPAFTRELKAISVEKGKMYKYDRMVNGSFRYYIPDHYRSGFEVVAWSYLKHDRQIWNRALEFTACMPFTVDPVNISLLKSSGMTRKRLFNDAFDNLSVIWGREDTMTSRARYEILNNRSGREYINYYSPVKAGDNLYAAVKTSLGRLPEFVILNSLDKTEKRIHVTGAIYPFVISSAPGILAWVETRADPRWNNRDYSVIMMLNLKNGKTIQLTRKSRYMSVSLSPDGKTAAATENTIDNKNNIVILDMKTGKVIVTVPSPGNAYLQRPCWSGDGKRVTMIFLTTSGEGILAFNVEDLSWDILVKEDRSDYQSAFLRNDSLFFVNSVTGTENIHLRLPEGKVIMITRSRFGATDLLLDRNLLLFSDYSSSGNNISAMPLGTRPADLPSPDDTAGYLIRKFKTPVVSGTFNQDASYKPEPYRKMMHLFGFHSWMPFYVDIDQFTSSPAPVKPGFTLLGQNHLSTITSTFGYEYSEKLHKFHSKVICKGWYPVLETRFDHGLQNQVFKPRYIVNDPMEIKPGINVSNSLHVPLFYQSGRFIRYLQPSFSVLYQNNYIFVEEKGSYDISQYQISGRIYFSNYYRRSVRDIYPRWAQVIDLNCSFYPFDRDIYDRYITFRTAFYFPGLWPNNSVKLRYEKDKQEVVLIPLGNRVNLPRGYEDIVSLDIDIVSLDYAAPLFYPDFNISSLLYIKRIRTGIFYDHAIGRGNYFETGKGVYKFLGQEESFSSFGLDLLADFHVFRLPFMISGGVTAGWRIETGSSFLGLKFNMDIFGTTIGRSGL
jgi:hypothetical protein